MSAGLDYFEQSEKTMTSRFAGAGLAALLALAACTASAQTLETGAWQGLMASPGQQLVDVTWNVARRGDSLDVTMKWTVVEFPIQHLHVAGDSLAFSWNPGFQIDCILVRREGGGYQGGCKDPWGGIGPMTLVPPGRKVHPEDIDVDRAYAVWGATRAQPPAPPQDLAEEPPTTLGTYVEVDGTRLNVRVQGEGAVTVVLEAGLGDDLGVWDAVQRQVATFARVVAYDRAGLGYSDPAPGPRTPEKIAGALHALLRQAGLAPPYVLVGHAEGAFFVRRFAARYPDEVAGLVLVDPSHERQAARWRALDEPSWKAYTQGRQTLFSMAPEPVRAEYEAVAAILAAERLPGADSLPDVPLVVLTAQRPAEQPRWVGETPAGRKAWYDLHHAWIGQVTHGEHVPMPASGSYIQLEDPEAVVAAIRRVVNRARRPGF